MGFGSGSHCLYVRVRNENVVSMQGRASQRQTGRSGLAAESVLGPVWWPVRVSLSCVLAWDRARAEGWIIYQVQEGLCLALGLPMISFPTDRTVPSRAGGFSLALAGGLGGLVERGKMSRAAWERGSFDPLSLGGRRRVLRSRWAGRQAGQLSRSLSGWPLGLPWSFPSQPRSKTKLGRRVQVQVSFGAANRIESDRGGSDRKERTLFVDPLSV